jgi:ribonucleoside-diphosphate reductase subunit M1
MPNIPEHNINMNKHYEQYFIELNKTVDVTVDLLRDILGSKSYDLNMDWVILDDLVNNIKKSTPDSMTLNDLYFYITDYCASFTGYHFDYNKLASRLCVDRLHKGTPEKLEDVVNILYNNQDVHGNHSPLITKEYHDIVVQNSERIEKEMDQSRDYNFDFFGIRTLERSYLFKIQAKNNKSNKKGQIIERPQHMIMRVAFGIHAHDLDDAFETYHYFSNKYFTQATPTLFNAGTEKSQFSSCYLLGIDDNIEGIFKQIGNMAFISKWAGGIGVHLSSIRSKGSIIRGTNGVSDGILPLCILLNKLAKYINQGGKRNGSIAVYLEPWHADILEFCELRKNTKDEDTKARDLFLALWVPDLFMKRVLEGGMWSLMCPDECPNLNKTYGEEFEKLYIKYEQEGKYKKQMKAIDLWYHILESQIETGIPYFLYKDHCNRKSNQKNLGTIRSSNLCAEIVQYSDGNTISVCNLASICLPAFIVKDEVTGMKSYDFDKLQKVTKIIVKNLNKIIDRNFYPTPETKISNLKNRPMGVGVQGLADVFNIMEYPFGSDEAKKLNKQIHETIYYAGLRESCDLARKFGKYESFDGSPFSEGLLQWHLWGLKESDLLMGFQWTKLIKDIKKWGTRNSLITALMPTASTSQIMGNYEAFEPYQSNIFVRSTLAGEFIVLNENLMRSLLELGLWSHDMRKRILINNGSIQSFSDIPEKIRDIYKTAFEIQQKDIIIQAAERGPFVDQSQSMNLFMEKISYDILMSCHIFSWKQGLKTGMYYLRSRPAVDPLQFGIDVDEMKRLKELDSGNKVQIITIKKQFTLDDIEIIKYIPKVGLDDILFKTNTQTRNVYKPECIGCSS